MTDEVVEHAEYGQTWEASRHDDRDPLGIEGPAGASPGLGLDIETTPAHEKHLPNVCRKLSFDDATTVRGYEIHHDKTEGDFIQAVRFHWRQSSSGRSDFHGWTGDRNLSHGLFDEPAAAQSVLTWAGCQAVESTDASHVLDLAIKRVSDALQDASIGNGPKQWVYA